MEEELRKEVSLKKHSSEVEVHLPLELMPYPLQSENTNRTKVCTLCEYLLLVFVYFGDITNVNEVINIKCCDFAYIILYIEFINISKFKEKVKEFLGRVCIKVPTSVGDDCQNVVNTYGGAILATLAMDIDPSLVIYFCI